MLPKLRVIERDENGNPTLVEGESDGYKCSFYKDGHTWRSRVTKKELAKAGCTLTPVYHPNLEDMQLRSTNWKVGFSLGMGRGSALLRFDSTDVVAAALPQQHAHAAPAAASPAPVPPAILTSLPAAPIPTPAQANAPELDMQPLKLRVLKRDSDGRPTTLGAYASWWHGAKLTLTLSAMDGHWSSFAELHTANNAYLGQYYITMVLAYGDNGIPNHITMPNHHVSFVLELTDVSPQAPSSSPAAAALEGPAVSSIVTSASLAPVPVAPSVQQSSIVDGGFIALDDNGMPILSMPGYGTLLSFVPSENPVPLTTTNAAVVPAAATSQPVPLAQAAPASAPPPPKKLSKTARKKANKQAREAAAAAAAAIEETAPVQASPPGAAVSDIVETNVLLRKERSEFSDVSPCFSGGIPLEGPANLHFALGWRLCENRWQISVTLSSVSLINQDVSFHVMTSVYLDPTPLLETSTAAVMSGPLPQLFLPTHNMLISFVLEDAPAIAPPLPDPAAVAAPPAADPPDAPGPAATELCPPVPGLGAVGTAYDPHAPGDMHGMGC